MYPVILSGGFGTRLWPVSRRTMPKQFSRAIFDQSLFAKTLALVSNADIFAQVVAVSNIGQELLVKNELQNNPDATIIFEPASRNTALSIALAAFLLQEKQNDIMLVMPSDHIISDISLFEKSIMDAKDVACQKIVTFGVDPTYPATGYGYIHKGNPIKNGFEVKAFTEKPNFEKAEKFLESGDYFWNAGIFLCSTGLYLSELQKFAPQTFEIAEKSMAQCKRFSNSIYIGKQPFEDAEKVSIDYAVLEKTANIAVFPMLSRWSDIGDFKAVADVLPKDLNNNVIVGDVASIDTKDCMVIGSDRLVATLGISNMTIVDTQDVLLISDSSRTQDIKYLVDKLENRREIEIHSKVLRPWGTYEIIKESENFKIKKIVVAPNSSLSLQSHKFRSEHWIVTSGTATVQNGDCVALLHTGESTFIQCNEKHRLSNETNEPVIIIEIQIGGYLGEDDIVRYQDDYGRK